VSERKSYLGDSVYVDFDGFSIVLTTENGYEPNNWIYMEPMIVDAFIGYVKRLSEANSAAPDAEAEVSE
jgi:hypothetical protein